VFDGPVVKNSSPSGGAAVGTFAPARSVQFGARNEKRRDIAGRRFRQGVHFTDTVSRRTTRWSAILLTAQIGDAGDPRR
jgi:hypothetical protein